MLFSREDDLRPLIEACLGNGVFRNLELYKEAEGITGHEYRLPNGARIDILGREDRVGSALLRQVDGYEIDRYCYHADFEKL